MYISVLVLHNIVRSECCCGLGRSRMVRFTSLNLWLNWNHTESNHDIAKRVSGFHGGSADSHHTIY